MPPTPKRRLRELSAGLFLLAFGISSAFAQAPSEDPQPRPQAPPAARTAHRNYFAWNPMDLFFTGRLTVGFEHIFRIGERYYGLFVQHSSPMNSVFPGMLTVNATPASMADEFTYPESLDVFLCLHGRGRTRAMRYYPRIGLSSILNQGETERGLYLAFGPCGRMSFGKYFHITFGLTTLKIKLRGNSNYNWLQLPLIDFTLGLEF
jgi:hypothetical protein